MPSRYGVVLAELRARIGWDCWAPKWWRAAWETVGTEIAPKDRMLMLLCVWTSVSVLAVLSLGFAAACPRRQSRREAAQSSATTEIKVIAGRLQPA